MPTGFAPSHALTTNYATRSSLSSSATSGRRALRRPALRRVPRATLSDLAPAEEAGAVVPSRGLGDLRIGHGYDLHRLEAGRPLILGGVELQHTVGCAGHSDGDAVYHCVVDAVLGALALPDIGQLFPDSDPRFKNCSSDVFMTAAYARLRLAGFRVGNIDITVILERPKLSPHKAVMRQHIAELLHAPLDAVNLKAKTHEKVDAVGENRAVEVHAVVVLLRDSEGLPPVPDADTPPAADARPITSPIAAGRNAAAQLLQLAGERAAAVSAATSIALDDVGVGAGAPECAVQKLYDTVLSRRGADKGSSWTAKLFSKGRQKIAQKVGEEAVEVVVGAVSDDERNVVTESADLLYHLCVLWADMGIEPVDVFDELQRREGSSGIKEKASRVK